MFAVCSDGSTGAHDALGHYAPSCNTWGSNTLGCNTLVGCNASNSQGRKVAIVDGHIVVLVKVLVLVLDVIAARASVCFVVWVGVASGYNGIDVLGGSVRRLGGLLLDGFRQDLLMELEFQSRCEPLLLHFLQPILLVEAALLLVNDPGFCLFKGQVQGIQGREVFGVCCSVPGCFFRFAIGDVFHIGKAAVEGFDAVQHLTELAGGISYGSLDQTLVRLFASRRKTVLSHSLLLLAFGFLLRAGQFFQLLKHWIEVLETI
mmetsp:Transcript_4702/g.13584  ORF Transcript_4702/g.13584 Transcript_4702/m.13584 type:complete len:261 (-) Transcript_4702:1557-2339(-)